MVTPITFNDLPTELKLLIFSSFGPGELNEKVAKICKNWRYLSCDPYIWRNFWIGGDKTPEEIVEVLNRNQFIRCVSFYKIRNFNWINYVEKHTSVRSITFKCCRLSINSIFRVIDIFPNIESVDIKYCRGVKPHVIMQFTRWDLLTSFKFRGSNFASFSDCIPEFARRTEHLQEVTLEIKSNIGAEAINGLIELRGENLKFLRLLTGNGVNVINDASQLISTTCHNLTEMELDVETLTDQHLLKFTNLPSLKILHMQFCFQSFSPMVKGVQFVNLTELVICSCFQLNDECLVSILKCCPRLSDLNLQWLNCISDEGLRSLPNICKNLELLVLARVDKVTKECVENVVLRLPNMCYCVTVNCPLIRNGNFFRLVDKPKSRMILFRNYYWIK